MTAYLQKNWHIVFLAGIVLCLCEVWLPGYFLTGDGPCHLYNARILHDIWAGDNAALYSRFFEVLRQPNPNWFTTVVLSALLYIADGAVAEKLFLTLYVLLYIAGFYLLLKRISPRPGLWLLVIFLFVFPGVIARGFYNFAFSIAFYFWVVWAWLRFLDGKHKMADAMLFLLFTFFTFFTHLLAFVFAAATCGALVLSFALALPAPGGKWRFFLKSSIMLLLLLLPFLYLMFWFTGKEGGLQLQLGHHFFRGVELVHLKYLLSLNMRELVFTTIAGVVLFLLTVFVVFRRIRSFKIHRYDGFLLALLLVSFVYLFFPDDFLGRAILIALRVQLFVAILMLCCVSYMDGSDKFKTLSGIIVFGCFVSLCVQRICTRLVASDGVEDYLSCAAHIRDGAVVLPLDLAPGGKDREGKEIANASWMFYHAGQYLGVGKPLIVLDNYEANTGYFPLVWKKEVNPYFKLDDDGAFEQTPPYAQIDAYRNEAGVTIDYIVMWCFDTSALQNEKFSRLYSVINDEYIKMYTSPSGRTLLYKRK